MAEWFRALEAPGSNPPTYRYLDFFSGPVHTSHFCRVEFNSIKCGRNATADSNVEFLPN